MPVLKFPVHDSTLRAMATSMPVSLEQFSQLPGVGERKLEKYGQIFMGVIETARQGQSA